MDVSEIDNQIKVEKDSVQDSVKNLQQEDLPELPLLVQDTPNNSDGASSQISDNSSDNSRRNKRKAQQPTKQTTGILTIDPKRPRVQKVNSSDRPYVCTTCLKSFTRSHHLTRHEYSHTGERPFICGTCGKSFIRKHKLTVHIRTHTGEKPFLCRVCSKGFSSSEKRKLHERIHSGEKPYHCMMCEKCFKSSSQLKRHSETHKKREAFEQAGGFGCSTCYKMFISEQHLANHKAKHEKKKLNDNKKLLLKSDKSQTVDTDSESKPALKGDLKIKVKLPVKKTNNSSVKTEMEEPKIIPSVSQLSDGPPTEVKSPKNKYVEQKIHSSELIDKKKSLEVVKCLKMSTNLNKDDQNNTKITKLQEYTHKKELAIQRDSNPIVKSPVKSGSLDLAVADSNFYSGQSNSPLTEASTCGTDTRLSTSHNNRFYNSSYPTSVDSLPFRESKGQQGHQAFSTEKYIPRQFIPGVGRHTTGQYSVPNDHEINSHYYETNQTGFPIGQTGSIPKTYHQSLPPESTNHLYPANAAMYMNSACMYPDGKSSQRHNAPVTSHHSLDINSSVQNSSTLPNFARFGSLN